MVFPLGLPSFEILVLDDVDAIRELGDLALAGVAEQGAGGNQQDVVVREGMVDESSALLFLPRCDLSRRLYSYRRHESEDR